MAVESWDLFKYELELSIDIGGKITPINNMQILRLLIERDYDNDVLPIMLLDLTLPLDWYHNIRENKLNVKFIMKLYKMKQVGDGAYNSKALCFSDKFVPIIDDDKPFMDKSTYNSIKYGSGFQENDMIIKDLENTYTFILFREDDLMSSKTVVNDILSSSNLLSATAYCLNKAKVKKVLMSTPDNTSTFKELMLLPIPLCSQLKYLDSFYGLYKAGAQIFFDFDCLYILNNTAKCTAWRQNEIKQVIFNIEKPNDSKDVMKGSYVDDKEKLIHIKVSKDELTMLNTATSSDNIVGSNSIYVNTNTGQTSTIKGETSQIGTASYNVKMSTVPNPYVATESELRTKEKTGIYVISVSNIDITTVTPNKEFKMITTLTEISNNIKGKFRISRFNTRFVKSGDKFDSMSTIELRRTDNS